MLSVVPTTPPPSPGSKRRISTDTIAKQPRPSRTILFIFDLLFFFSIASDRNNSIACETLCKPGKIDLERLRARRAVPMVVEPPKPKPDGMSDREWARANSGDPPLAPSAPGSIVYDTIDLNKPGNSLLHSAYPIPDLDADTLVADDSTPFSCITAHGNNELRVKCPANEDEYSDACDTDMYVAAPRFLGEKKLETPMRAFSRIVVGKYGGGITRLGKNQGYKGKLVSRDSYRSHRIHPGGSVVMGATSRHCNAAGPVQEVNEDLPEEFFRSDADSEEFFVDCMCVGHDQELVFVWSDDRLGTHSVGIVSADGKDFVFVAELGEARVSSITIDGRGNLVLLGEWTDGDDTGTPAVVVLDTGAENPANWAELRDLPTVSEDDEQEVALAFEEAPPTLEVDF